MLCISRYITARISLPQRVQEQSNKKWNQILALTKPKVIRWVNWEHVMLILTGKDNTLRWPNRGFSGSWKGVIKVTSTQAGWRTRWEGMLNQTANFSNKTTGSKQGSCQAELLQLKGNKHVEQVTRRGSWNKDCTWAQKTPGFVSREERDSGFFFFVESRMLGLRHTLKQQVCQAILGCLKLCILPYTVQQNSPCCCHTLTLEPWLKEIPPHRILPSCSLFGPNHLNWEQFSQTPPCCRLQQSEKWAVGMSLSPTSSDLLKHRRNLPLLLHDPPEILTEVLEKWGDQRHLWAHFPGETSQGLGLLSPDICPERGRFPHIYQRRPACSLNATQEREWDRKNNSIFILK